MSGKENCPLPSKFHSHKCLLYLFQENSVWMALDSTLDDRLRSLLKIYFPSIWSVRQTLLHTAMEVRQFYALLANKLLTFSIFYVPDVEIVTSLRAFLFLVENRYSILKIGKRKLFFSYFPNTHWHSLTEKLPVSSFSRSDTVSQNITI